MDKNYDPLGSLEDPAIVPVKTSAAHQVAREVIADQVDAGSKQLRTVGDLRAEAAASQELQRENVMLKGQLQASLDIKRTLQDRNKWLERDLAVGGNEFNKMNDEINWLRELVLTLAKGS